MSIAAAHTSPTATMSTTNEVIAGRARRRSDARSAENRISGIAMGTQTSATVVAIEVSLNRKLAVKPVI